MILSILDLPSSKNLIRSLTHKGYYSKIKRLRNDFDLCVMVASHQAKFPKLKKKKVLNIIFYKKQRGGRLNDPINYLDELLDSLVRMGVLYDDSQQWFELGSSPTIIRSDRNETRIEVL